MQALVRNPLELPRPTDHRERRNVRFQEGQLSPLLIRFMRRSKYAVSTSRSQHVTQPHSPRHGVLEVHNRECRRAHQACSGTCHSIFSRHWLIYRMIQPVALIIHSMARHNVVQPFLRIEVATARNTVPWKTKRPSDFIILSEHTKHGDQHWYGCRRPTSLSRCTLSAMRRWGHTMKMLATWP